MGKDTKLKTRIYPQSYRKKPRNINHEHLVQVTPKIRYPVLGVLMNSIQTLRCYTKPGTTGEDVSLWGVCKRRSGATCCQRSHEVACTLPGSQDSTYLRSINSLARNVTKWTVDDDAKLYHLDVLRQL